MKSYCLHWMRVFQSIGKSFLRDRYTRQASSLTFTSLLAMVPFICVMMSIFSAFPVFRDMGKEIQEYVFVNFLPASQSAIQPYIQNFVDQASKLPAVGIVFLVVTVFLMLLTVEKAFNEIWQVRHGRRGASAFVHYWALMTLTPLFIGLSFLVSSYLVSLPFVDNAAVNLGLKKPFLASVPFILNILAFAFLYIVVPNRKVPLRYGFLGAVIAAILLEVAKKGFAFYLHNFPSYEFIYGAMATVPIFLIWLYLSWLIILFGALVARTSLLEKQIGMMPQADGFSYTFIWLGLLWQAQQEGKGLSLQKMVEKTECGYHQAPEVILEFLEEHDLIRTDARGNYFLAKDIAELTLDDLYLILPFRLPRISDEEIAKHEWLAALSKALQKTHKNLRKTLDVPVVDLYKQLLKN